MDLFQQRKHTDKCFMYIYIFTSQKMEGYIILILWVCVCISLLYFCTIILHHYFSIFSASTWNAYNLFIYCGHAACGILVPRPEIEPAPHPQWKLRVLTAGPRGNLFKSRDFTKEEMTPAKWNHKQLLCEIIHSDASFHPLL